LDYWRLHHTSDPMQLSNICNWRIQMVQYLILTLQYLSGCFMLLPCLH
jgi:hypothetical protein